MGRTKQLFEEMRLEQQDFFNKKYNIPNIRIL